MTAAPLLRRLCVLLFLCSGILDAFGKPITPHGPHGATLSTAPRLRIQAESVETEGETPPAQFTSVPAPLPPNLAGLNFEMTGTSEFGDLVRLNGAAHFVGSVSVAMSSGAIRSDYPGANAYGFTHSATVTVYSVDRSGPTPAPGAILARTTESFLMPWRPEPDAASAGLPGRPWRAEDGHLYTGRVFTLTFDVGDLGLALPDEVILAVAYNTQHFGPHPLGVAGPYDHLALAVTDELPTVGVDLNTDVVYWKTTHAADYADAGVAGANTLRADSGWVPFKPAMRVTDSNYGALYATIAQIETLQGADRESRVALNAARSFVVDALDRQIWDGNQRLDSAFGSYFFEFLAEATDALEGVAARRAIDEAVARQMINEWMVSTITLADTAIVDALILGGDTRHILRAQKAADEAGELRAEGTAAPAVDRLGAAWRDALESLR